MTVWDDNYYEDEDEDDDEDLPIADLLDGDIGQDENDAECVICGGIFGVDVAFGEDTSGGPICAECSE